MPKEEPELDRARLGRRSKRKGAHHEREVAEILRKLYPNAKRGLGQARAGGEVPDVAGTPWWVEAKHRKVENVRAALRQAEDARDASPGYKRHPPLVVSRKDHQRDIVVMYLDDFVALMDFILN